MTFATRLILFLTFLQLNLRRLTAAISLGNFECFVKLHKVDYITDVCPSSQKKTGNKTHYSLVNEGLRKKN